jgi:hypothetical protein
MDDQRANREGSEVALNRLGALATLCAVVIGVVVGITEGRYWLLGIGVVALPFAITGCWKQFKK